MGKLWQNFNHFKGTQFSSFTNPLIISNHNDYLSQKNTKLDILKMCGYNLSSKYLRKHQIGTGTWNYYWQKIENIYKEASSFQKNTTKTSVLYSMQPEVEHQETLMLLSASVCCSTHKERERKESTDEHLHENETNISTLKAQWLSHFAVHLTKQLQTAYAILHTDWTPHWGFSRKNENPIPAHCIEAKTFH